MSPIEHVGLQADVLARRRSGKIVTEDARLLSVYGRWWPYLGSWCETLWDIRWRPAARDRCELYYHEPFSSPGFLALSYIRSGPCTSLSTFYAATLVLDEVARLKDSRAIVCHVTNDRISDRLLRRWNWEAHCLDWPGRHYIKRLYGSHPPIPAGWRRRLRLDPAG